jgi:hypothetical protein
MNDMTEKKVIGEFRGEYRFLSNFWLCEIAYEGERYASTEHAFQAAKTFNQSDRARIRKMSCTEAKRYGRKVQLIEGWENKKVGIMEDLVLQKFVVHADLQEKLLATGDAELIEGNDWGDVEWGQVNGVGKNHLGKILMRVRKKIREEKME